MLCIRKEEGGLNNKIGKSKAYALWSDGDKNKWQRGLIVAKEDSITYDTNDQVCMILDLSN